MEGCCIHRNKPSGSIQRCDLADLPRNCELVTKDSFLRDLLHLYIRTRINYNIVPVNIFNKYLHYETSGTEYV